MKAFQLLDEAWIPISGGSKVGLKEALLQAHQWDRVEHLSPLVSISIYRLLLAILQRALRGPQNIGDCLELFKTGRFPADPISEYLERYRERFWLFHPEQPFYQMADLPRERFQDPWQRLASEYGSGNTSFLTNISLREKAPTLEGPIDFDEAACRLLEYQNFALGGLIKRFVTSAPAAPGAAGVLILPEGKNLFEQLCQSLTPYKEQFQGEDLPIWEQSPILRSQVDRKKICYQPIRGLTHWLTWFSRSIRLLPEDGQVRDIALAAGIVARGEPCHYEPMMCFIPDKKGNPRALSWRSGRGLWRDYHSLLPGDSSHNRISVIAQAQEIHHEFELDGASFRAYGVCTNKGKILSIRSESFNFPKLAHLPEVVAHLRDRLQEIDNVRSLLYSTGRVLAEELLKARARKVEEISPHTKTITALSQTFQHEDNFLPLAERRFKAYLARLPDDSDEYDRTHDQRIVTWRRHLIQDARIAFEVAVTSCGNSSAAIRAAALASRYLEAGLRKTLEVSASA